MTRVLCVNLSYATERDYRRLYDLASPERRARANACRRRDDALRCLAADVLMRRVLGPHYSRVEKTPEGKLFLPNRNDLHFNLSHSGYWAVIAWGPAEVGVDVEDPDRDLNMDAIARRFFAEEERQYVFSDESGQQQRFFEIWTAKESYLKYLGTGLKRNLSSFSVLSPDPGIRFHRVTLPLGAPLCLCTTEENYRVELVDVYLL